MTGRVGGSIGRRGERLVGPPRDPRWLEQLAAELRPSLPRQKTTEKPTRVDRDGVVYA